MKRIMSAVLVAAVAVVQVPLTASQSSVETIEHSGMCDASAAVAVGPTTFVVANDEDNILRVYRRDTPGPPVHSVDLTSFLKPDPEHPEADIEGATRVGDRVFWITSHGANKDGKRRPSRHRLFATDVKVVGDQVTITPVETPYMNLVKDLAGAPGLKAFKLGDAAAKAPEDAGGLNIEGLAATPQGGLLIGFRNPLPDGKALLVPLENPQEVVTGRAAKLGPPLLLPLGGLGVRSLEYFAPRNRYLIVAGPRGDQGGFKLYQWSGSAQAPDVIDTVQLGGVQPEALIVYPEEKTRIQLLSDDGGKQVDGKDCKKAKNPSKRSFRSVWVTP